MSDRASNNVLWRATVAMLVMLLAAGAAEWVKPSRKLVDEIGRVDIEHAIPDGIADWRQDRWAGGLVINPQQEAALSAIYNQVVTRTYVSPRGERLMLSIAYGEDQRDAMSLHYPEVCYPAQGFEVRANTQQALDTPKGTIQVRRLMTRQGPRLEPVTYWVVIGRRNTLGGIDKKLIELDYARRGQIPDGLLFRVSSIDADAGHAFALHDQFIRALAAGLPDPLLQRIYGLH